MGAAQPFRGYPSKTEYARARAAEGADVKTIAAELGCTYGAAHNLVSFNAVLEERKRILNREAARRGMNARELRNKLINIICDDNLFEAILDEEAPEGRS